MAQITTELVRYLVVCHYKFNNKDELGWVSQPKSTKTDAKRLISRLETEPDKCPGPHEIQEYLV